MCKVAIYEALPLAFDSIFEAACHVVVVSQFVNCIKEQVLNKLPNLGILAASLSDISEGNATGVRAKKR